MEFETNRPVLFPAVVSDGYTSALIVPEDIAQTMRAHLEADQVWDSSRSFLRLGDRKVAIPIRSDDEAISLISVKWPQYEVKDVELPQSKKSRLKNQTPENRLKTYLLAALKRNGLPERLVKEIPTKWEKHGDLAIVPSTAFVSPEWDNIEDLWMTVTKSLSCKRVARHSPIAADRFRSSQVQMLLGDNGLVEHLDNGIKYQYDVTKCMFSAGNITEKLRVASWDCSNETVVDLYAGIGYFTLPYLVHAKAAYLHACEWNLNAVAALKNNLLLNGVSERCTVHIGDNRKLEIPSIADRVNLGLIPSSEDGWETAVRILRPDRGGILHIHGNVDTHIWLKAVGTVPDQEFIAGNIEFDDLNEKLRESGNSEVCESGSDKTFAVVESGVSNSEFITPNDTGGMSAGCLKSGGTILNGVVCENDLVDTKTSARSSEGDLINDETQMSIKSRCSMLTGGSNLIQLGKNGNLNSCKSLVGNASDLTDSKISNKENTRTACAQWSLHVEGKIKALLQRIKGHDWNTRIVHVETVKSYAPHVFHAVLDLECRPT